MNALFTLRRTPAGSTPEAREHDVFGYDVYHVVAVRNERTRTVRVPKSKATFDIHDEEWLCVVDDGYVFSLAGNDLDHFREHHLGLGYFRAS